MDREQNEKLERAYQSTLRIKKIDVMLETLKKDRVNFEDRAYTQKERLAKEGYDVWKLDNDQGIASFFLSIAGKQDEREEKEERELLSARLKANQAEKDLNSLEDRILRLEREREVHEEISRDFDALYDRKKNDIIAASGEGAKKVLDLIERLNKAKAELKETTEAKRAGEGVSSSLQGVLSSLGQAEMFGMLDVSGRRGYYYSNSDFSKYARLDDARMQIGIAQRLMIDFKSELKDVLIYDDELKIDISAFMEFMDFFFDGFIVDLLVQERIYEIQAKVQRTKDQVTRLLGRFDFIEEQLKKSVDELTQEADEAVVEG